MDYFIVRNYFSFSSWEWMKSLTFFAVVLTQQQKDRQRTFWVKRWLEMPEEWRIFPEVGEQRFTDGWKEDYAWNLDPMVVGELAALANCGHPPDLDLTDEELTKWVQELDVTELPGDFPHTLMSLWGLSSLPLFFLKILPRCPPKSRKKSFRMFFLLSKIFCINKLLFCGRIIA